MTCAASHWHAPQRKVDAAHPSDFDLHARQCYFHAERNRQVREILGGDKLQFFFVSRIFSREDQTLDICILIILKSSWERYSHLFDLI